MTLSDLETRLTSLEAEVSRLWEELEHTKEIMAIEQGIAQIKRGEGVPAREALEEIRKKYNIPRR
jgi:hypothetical protein